MKFTPCQSMRSHQAMADSPSLQLSELKGLKMIRKIVPAAVLAATMAAAGCAEGTTTQDATDATSSAVAIVNGEVISRDVWELFVKTRTRGGDADELTDEQKKENLDNLIEMYVAAQQAVKDGLESGEDGARIELMRQSALADIAGKKILDGKEPTPEELKAEYEKQIALMPQIEYHARHILVEDEAKAREMIAALDSGSSFETLAEQNSSDSSAQEGGDLGWFAASRMVKPFADAVQALEKGTYTKEPVQSQFGWHVIRLDDTRPLTPPTYEAVEQQLGQLVNQSKFQAYLDELMKTAKVERKL
jgi:peptidyl-prolyl cis-trans isomerase C